MIEENNNKVNDGLTDIDNNFDVKFNELQNVEEVKEKPTGNTTLGDLEKRFEDITGRKVGEKPQPQQPQPLIGGKRLTYKKNNKKSVKKKGGKKKSNKKRVRNVTKGGRRKLSKTRRNVRSKK